MAAFGDDDKTEEATPAKLEEAREQGDVAHSRDFATLIVYLGFALVVYFTASRMFHTMVDVIQRYFDFNAHRVETVPDAIVIGKMISLDMFKMVGPLLATVFLFGIASYVSQFGFLFTTEKLQFNIERLNPLSGLQKIFSIETLIELIKSIIKIVMISGVLYLVLKGEVEHLLELGSYPVGVIFIYFVKLLAKCFLSLLVFMALLGLADFAYQKWSYAMRMRMSVQEIKDEHKQRDGDPQVKARIRQIQRDRARKRMMEEVPQADVVVTNPTHVAVAIKYKRGEMRAPIVVAKGAGFIALKIKELAMKHNVPIVEKRVLARFLYRNIEVNEPIPESLYTAVAEVLAYVYKMRKKFDEWRAKAALA